MKSFYVKKFKFKFTNKIPAYSLTLKVDFNTIPWINFYNYMRQDAINKQGTVTLSNFYSL